MKYLISYNESKKDWSKLVNDLIDGYYSQVFQENNISELIDDVRDVILPISDIGQETELYFNIYFDYKGLRRQRRLVKNLTSINISPDERFKSVIEFRKTGWGNYRRLVYQDWKEVSSILKNIVDQQEAWFGINLLFKSVKLKKGKCVDEFKDIKYGLESRGWTINQLGLGRDYMFSFVNDFSFDILRPISIASSNQWLVDSGLINESKEVKLFENFNLKRFRVPDNFIRLDSIGHVLDPEKGLMYAVWKNGRYDIENPYEVEYDNGIENISDEEKQIVDKFWLSCEDIKKDEINWKLIEMAKDLSLDYLDEHNELIIKVIATETKTQLFKRRLMIDDRIFVYNEIFSHEEDNITWNKYFPNKMNIVKNGFLTYEFTIQPQRESKNWGIKAWEPEMTRELSSKLIEMFPDETIVNR